MPSLRTLIYCISLDFVYLNAIPHFDDILGVGNNVKNDNSFRADRLHFLESRARTPWLKKELGIPSATGVIKKTTRDLIDVDDSSCNMAMFGGDTNAYWACLTESALQTNWFPSPISGLYSYQDWNSFDGFWQNGAVLETLANFAHYANHTRYRNAILSSYRNLTELLNAYQPQPSFDDEAWFGISYAKIYEVFGETRFLNTAVDIYNWSWELGWDSTGTCNGGFWFDGAYGSKVTITNAQFLYLGAKLYRLTGSKNQDFLNKIKEIWNFIESNKIIDPVTFQVSDGIDLVTCAVNKFYGWTYDSGVLIGALVEIFKISSDPSTIKLAHAIANATITNLSKDGVLTENCDANGCQDNDDAKMFKGIFVRHLRYLIDVSDDDHRRSYTKWIQININSVINSTLCMEPIQNCNVTLSDGKPNSNLTGPVFDTSWRGPFRHTAPAQQTSVLDLFIAGIASGTQCQGQGCHYDPVIPPIKPLTCKDNPCPPHRECCNFYTGYQTCCTTKEKCIAGDGCYTTS